MVHLTETAISKVNEILSTQEPKPAGLRISVVGGGCSGFSYSMAFENAPGMLDKTSNFGDLRVFVDQASLLYLEGADNPLVMAISIHPYLTGVPHRIKYLEMLYDYILGHHEKHGGVVMWTGAEIYVICSECNSGKLCITIGIFNGYATTYEHSSAVCFKSSRRQVESLRP